MLINLFIFIYFRQDIVPGYNCEFCDRVFSRFVILKKHLEVHRKRRNSENSDNDD